jgi:hypothetical protein
VISDRAEMSKSVPLARLPGKENDGRGPARRRERSRDDREVTMQYLILAAEDDAAFAARDDADRSAAYWESWQGYIAALTESGLLAGAGGLQPPWTATTVRVRDGRRSVQDGPYAETKEQLGGYFVIDAPDLDTALLWAERCPASSYASVEVRPLLPPPGA